MERQGKDWRKTCTPQTFGKGSVSRLKNSWQSILKRQASNKWVGERKPRPATLVRIFSGQNWDLRKMRERKLRSFKPKVKLLSFSPSSTVGEGELGRVRGFFFFFFLSVHLSWVLFWSPLPPSSPPPPFPPPPSPSSVWKNPWCPQLLLVFRTGAGHGGRWPVSSVG